MITNRRATFLDTVALAAVLAMESLRAQKARSGLAILGVVIGIVTVVLVASTLVGLRNSVALLFRELGTDNIFAYHLNGEPYSAPTELDTVLIEGVSSNFFDVVGAAFKQGRPFTATEERARGQVAVIGALVAFVAPSFPAAPPLWAVTAGLVTSVAVGVIAGYWPARTASALDPVEALRYE